MPQHVALAADLLATATDDVLWLTTIADGAHLRTLSLPWAIDEIAVSPSGRFIAAAPSVPRREIVVYDRLEAATTTISKSSDRWLSGFGFAADPHSDLLVVARDQFSCSTLDLRAGAQEIARLVGGGFEFDRLGGLWGDVLVSVGHYSGETRDSLVVVHAGPDGSCGDELDFAYRLIAGRAEQGAFVAFRDPEDAERPAPDDDDDDDHADIHDFLGIYIRDVASGELREKIAWDDPGVRRGDHCFATEHWVAITNGGGVSLVPRARSAGSPATLPAHAAGLDPIGRRIALTVEEANIDVAQL